MKKIALTATVLATLAAPTMTFAQDMFPNLTYPDTWETQTNTDTVAMPFVPLITSEE